MAKKDTDVVIIIPARFLSKRLPGKPLLEKDKKPIVQYVYENAQRSKAHKVIVATDDERIFSSVKQFEGNVMMTSSEHQSGTQRIAEVAENLVDFEGIVINLQGDEPCLNPQAIDTLIDVQKQFNPFMSTLCARFQPHLHTGPFSPLDPSAVKVALSRPLIDGAAHSFLIRKALYFSRSLIPYTPHAHNHIAAPEDYFLHIGIYAFSKKSLKEFIHLPHGNLEKRECLEQLRALENGQTILTAEIPFTRPGIDTQHDYEAFLNDKK